MYLQHTLLGYDCEDRGYFIKSLGVYTYSNVEHQKLRTNIGDITVEGSPSKM